MRKKASVLLVMLKSDWPAFLMAALGLSVGVYFAWLAATQQLEPLQHFVQSRAL